MKARIGINIAATLDVSWRGHLWREAARLKIDLPTKVSYPTFEFVKPRLMTSSPAALEASIC